MLVYFTSSIEAYIHLYGLAIAYGFYDILKLHFIFFDGTDIFIQAVLNCGDIMEFAY